MIRPPRALVPALLPVLLLALACTGTGTAPAPRPATPAAAAGLPPELALELSDDARAWVEQTLAGLSLEQKAAQMVMVRAFGRYQHPQSASYRALLAEVAERGVGGVVVFDSDLESLPPLLNALQEAAALPLLVASDLERGVGFRVQRDSVSLPSAMAIGATRSPDAARFVGEVTGREGRALGIHWALAPVADVNNNPANPVINVRSFGEDPALVGAMTAAFVAGARAEGMLTTVKHFPGHGDTGVDSHVALPVLGVDRARLDAVELAPFRQAISAGVDAVMLGHIAVPALDASGTPASLSPPIASDLLRDELGFGGLVVTDAMEMRGLIGTAEDGEDDEDAEGEGGGPRSQPAHPTWGGGTAIAAVQAGADVLLLPADTRVAIQSLARAVAEGQLSEARLDRSVRRILEAKARLGLHRRRAVDPAGVARAIARPENNAKAAAIASQSITLVRNHEALLPLAAEDELSLLHVTIASDFDYHGLPAAALAGRGVAVDSHHVGREVSPETEEALVATAPRSTHIVISAFVRATSGGPDGTQRPALSASQARLLARLTATGVPTLLISFGSPYLLSEVPEVDAYLCAYGDSEASQRAAIQAVFGEVEITGKLPVTLPGLYDFGHGIALPRRATTLDEEIASGGPELAAFADVDRLLEGFVAEGAFPGAVVAVGQRGRLLHLRAFGRQRYEPDTPAVTVDTIYDLASLTKVIATTTMAMMLVDDERLNLDSPVADFLPHFTGGGKERVTLRHLLTHSSGIDWWAPLFEQGGSRAQILERILAMPLAYEPGTDTKYSDLGILLLGEILERVAGEPLERFVQRRLFGPLGMTDTRFRPLDPATGGGPDLLARIAPTEVDPARGGIVHGHVHDENAFALGGIAPHTGLFSTAPDLARFAQMMLQKGAYNHRRLIARRTVERFTRRAGLATSSDRALGWDTKSPEGSSAGTLFSANSYGHTGFTGTSLWVDPERELFLILLTNRVHPTRENNTIRQVRPAVADAVVRAVERLDAQADAPAPRPPRVRVGLERLAERGPYSPSAHLKGADGTPKRIGLVAHAASVTWDGRHAIDVLRERGLSVVRLFSPEHGLRGQAAAGEAVANGMDPESGLPVVSLYGEHKAPTPEQLADLNALVIDLQGAGVRFYTYVSTLLLCLDAAAEAGVPVTVLDRPNPLGGERVEGPVAAPRDQVPASFVNLVPGPLIHGLTFGEMARYANSLREKPADLTIIPMTGWRRAMTWADTGRRWVPPSPNLRTPEAALAYPGVALLEATNVSEGRGTEAPFLRIGAPWLDPAAIQITAPGFTLGLTPITPRASAAAPHPKYQDLSFLGWRVRVANPGVAEPYRLGVELLARLVQQPAFEWQRDGQALTWLLGTPNLLQALQAGQSVDAILALDTAGHEAWREARQPFLLYR